MLDRRVPVALSCAALVLFVLPGCRTMRDRRRQHDLVVGAGVVDLGILQDPIFMVPGAMLEYRAPRVWRRFRPIGGVQVGERKDVLGYAGVAYDRRIHRDFFVTASFSAGALSRGDAKDMGSTHQFRSAVEVSRRLRKGRRVGVLLQHVSNGRTEGRNPGAESLYLTFSQPLGRR